MYQVEFFIKVPRIFRKGIAELMGPQQNGWLAHFAKSRNIAGDNDGVIIVIFQFTLSFYPN
jgi:hypothetical protein